VPADEAATGIPDPAHNVDAIPNYSRVCTGSGLDASARCTRAVVAAIDHARRLEGVRPLVLPAGYAQLGVPEQIFVVTNLERVDRGLPPLAGLVAGLNRDAAVGARQADDPPIPGPAYVVVDTEWSGGAWSALDADYGWMYNDGFDSGNLDCPHRKSPGCWGHRRGILDDLGSGPLLVAGAAYDPHGDSSDGDAGGTSMALVLATASARQPLVFTWAQVTGSAAAPQAAGAA